MKRFLKYIIIFILGFLSIFMFAYLSRPKNSENYLAAINPKIKLLDSVKSPRIIFLGGSNVCFGIDSKTISDSIGIPVIDFGLHAGAGLKLYIDIVLRKAQQYDIVVLMPELQHFYSRFNGDASVLSPLFFLCEDKYKNDILKSLNTTQTISIIGGFPKALYDIYRSERISDSIYNVRGFNEVGDHYTHWNVGKPSKFNDLSPITVAIDPYALHYTSSKVEELKNQGANVLIFPPTVTESYYDSEIEKFNELASSFSNVGIDFAVNTDAHTVPDDYCFDGIYHRDKRGVDIVTQRIILELKSLINN